MLIGILTGDLTVCHTLCMRQKEKGSLAIVTALIVVLLLIMGAGVYLYLHSSSVNSDTTTAQNPTPTTTVTDFAPNLAKSQKARIMIENTDSSKEEILLSKTQVDSYVKSLSSNEKVISISQ